MNVKVGQVWTFMRHTQWEVVELRDDGKWKCRCVNVDGSKIWIVGAVAYFLLSTPGWTLVRDVEPQGPQAGEWQKQLIAGWRRVDEEDDGDGWCPGCAKCEPTNAAHRHGEPVQPVKPAREWLIDLERTDPSVVDADMRRRNDEFADRYKAQIKAALASLGTEGFTQRVPSRSWSA